MSERRDQLERLLEVGRRREARELLGAELGEYPDNPEVRVLAARLALLESDPEEARLQLGSALQAAPDHFLARFLLFHVEADADRDAEAEGLITALLRDHPQEASLYAAYADLMLKNLHVEKARRLVDEALRLDPTDESARLADVLLATIEGKSARAQAQIHELIADDPTRRDFVWSLVVTLVQRNRNREALELARELLRSNPDNEALVDLIVDLRMRTHPLSIALWPMMRFGWAASAALWLGAVVMLNALRGTKSPWVGAIGLTYVVWVVYTWVYPALMRRWLRWRGA